MGTPCCVYTFCESIESVIVFSDIRWTLWMNGHTKTRPPGIIRGCEWQHPEMSGSELPQTPVVRLILSGATGMKYTRRSQEVIYYATRDPTTRRRHLRS